MKPLHWLMPALVLAFVAPASATVTQTPTFIGCAPEPELAGLLKILGVKQIIGGTTGSNDEKIAEVWVNPRTKLWVVVKRDPEAKQACIVLIGEQLTAKAPKP